MFEYHKIPEWYNMYLDYNTLKMQIYVFRDGCNLYKETKKRMAKSQSQVMDERAAGVKDEVVDQERGPREPDHGENGCRNSSDVHTSFHIEHVMRLPGYYFLSVDKSRLICLNKLVKAALMG